MPKLPVYILHGRLGVGKTTILTKLLKRDEFSDAFIVENEFAGHSVDGNRLSQEHPHVRIYELSGTCVCCTGSDDLMNTLLKLSEGKHGEAPIIIETTGAADAANLMKSLLLDPAFHERFALKANLLVIDALTAHHEADHINSLQEDIALADRTILTKTDLLAENDATQIVADAQQFAPGRIVRANHGTLPDDFGILEPSSRALDGLVALADVADKKLHEEVSWKAMSLPACTTAELIEALTKARAVGATILRVKGTINDKNGKTWRIDGTEHLTESVLAEHPAEQPTLVLIGKNLPERLEL